MAEARRFFQGLSRDGSGLAEAEKKYEYFWLEESPFSQWHKSSFELSGIEFNCAEQYMMYNKAKILGDDETAEKILKSKDPKTQKQLGRGIKSTDWDLWDSQSQRVVEEGNVAKFTQNPDLKKRLFATSPKILAEASPYDTRWGIGYKKTDPKAWDESTWNGTNYLGEILTNIRDKLMKEAGDPV